MSALDDYIYAMEAMGENDAAGFVVLGLAVGASGSCGVGTRDGGEAVPVPDCAGTASWQPTGLAGLPLPLVLAATDAWHPAWGREALPSWDVCGQARTSLWLDLVLAPLWTSAGSGAAGVAALPLPGLWAATSMDRLGRATATLPAFGCAAYACSLDNPVTNAAGSDAVVALLNQGDPAMGLAAAALAGGVGPAAGEDALAGALLDGVARHLAYVADASGDDVWTCAGGTYFRGTGDCEDGAILLHALLLAAGVTPDRLVTAFGRIGVDREGHAWVGYRRRGDGRFVALDWTRGPGQGGVEALPLLDEPGLYVVVDYALSATTFAAVRQDATVFFTAACRVGLALPSLGVVAVGRTGAWAGLALAATGWGCLGRCGGQGACGLPRLRVAGLAGSVSGRAALPQASVTARAGARGTGLLPVARLQGGSGGGARAALRWCRFGLVATAEAASTAQALAVLGRIRACGGALGGSCGLGGCGLPCPWVAAEAGASRLAAVNCWLPLPQGLAWGGRPPRGAGLCLLPGCRSAGNLGPADGGVAGYVWNGCAGEEWA